MREPEQRIFTEQKIYHLSEPTDFNDIIAGAFISVVVSAIALWAFRQYINKK